jgi:hypothetical protein
MFRRSPCEEFHINPLKNPYTGRSITQGSSTYNRLVRECGEPGVIPAQGTIPKRNINMNIDPKNGIDIETPVQYIARDMKLEKQIRRKLENVILTEKPKIHSEIRPLHDNDDDPEIIRKLIESGVTLISFKHSGIYEIVGYLMYLRDFDYMKQLVSELGFSNLKDKMHVLYNLVYFLIGDTQRVLNRSETRYISGQPIDVLHLMLPGINNPQYNNDRESILYTMTTGHTLPPRLSINNNVRYKEVTEYPPRGVYFRFNVIKNKTSMFSPYDYVANMFRTAVEDIFMLVTNDNLDEFIERYGVVFNRYFIEWDDLSEPDLYKFLVEINEYDDVFTREPDISPPPNIDDPDDPNILNILNKYTTRELLDAYGYPDDIIDMKNHPDSSYRQLLIQTILEDARRPIWTWGNEYCEDKGEIDDPVLKCGVQDDYRCYRISELIEILSQVPDEDIYLDRDTYPFPPYTLKQLLALLQVAPDNTLNNAPNIMELINIINTTDYIIRENELDKIVSEFDNFTSEQQLQAKLFIAWIFFYGNWRRYWEGPNYPWIYDLANERPDYIEDGIHDDEEKFIDRADYGKDNFERVANHRRTQFQTDILDTFIEQMDPIVRDWSYRVGNASYHFRRNIGEYWLVPILNILKDETHEFNDSDTFLQTGYYLMQHILHLNRPQQIDMFLNEIMPKLLEMELQKISQEMDVNSPIMTYINENRRITCDNALLVIDELRFLNTRKIDIVRSPRELEPFRPRGVKNIE